MIDERRAELGLRPEQAVAGGLTLSQLVFSDDMFANAKENAAALGSLLLEDGAVDASQLNQAIHQQQGDRKLPIGQILVQHPV